MTKKTLDFSSVADDPAGFSRLFLRTPHGEPLEPHSGQVTLLRGILALTVVVCGRQWGKSVAMAMYACWYAVTHKHRQVYIVAPTLDQSRIIFNEIANQFRNGPLASLLVGKIIEYPFPKMKLANGTEIHARGANSPQFLRGKKAHLVIVDEAAFCKDNVLTDVIEPMFTVTGKEQDSALILISTPFGLGAFFDYYTSSKHADDGTARAFHFESSTNPHADQKFLDRVKARYGEDSITWRTEYLAEFVDDDLSVFPAKYIKRAYEAYPYLDGETQKFPVAPIKQHRYTQGVDLANTRDWFVSSIIDATDQNLLVMINMTRMQKRGYTTYKAAVRDNYRRYNNARTMIDATSLGESVVEDLQDINADGYKFTEQSKYEVVSELSRLFCEHRLAIPYDLTIISELNNFAYKYTQSKAVKMEAKKGHDDIVVSLALACHLAIIPAHLGLFTAVELKPEIKHAPGRDPWSDLFKDNYELVS